MTYIKLAKTAGFCWGVKRAIDITLKAASSNSGSTYTFGPLIHNPQLIKLLESKNIYALNDISDISEGEVIIRTHGITPEKRGQIKSAGLAIKDATCPLVARVQGLIKKHSRKGYSIIIIGDEGHAEVVGLKGFARTPVHVIGSADGVPGLPDYSKVFVVAQTTCDTKKYSDAVKLLNEKYSSLEVGDTICEATTERQKEVIDLASEVDVLVVVGGRNSANTKRLASIAMEHGVKTFQVETDEELNLSELNGFEKIGVTAGASTPNWMIERVVGKIKKAGKYDAGAFSSLAEWMRFLIQSNLYLAFGAMVLTMANMIVMGIVPKLQVMGISFFAILSIYLLNQLLRIEELKQGNRERYKYHTRVPKLFWAVGLVSFFAGAALSWNIGFAVLAVYLALTGLGATYGLAFPLFRKVLSIESLKDIPASKDIFVALAWAIITVIIPYMANGQAAHLLIPFLFTFGVAYIRRVLFDFREMHSDQVVGRETIPMLVGKEKAAAMLYAVVMFLGVVLTISLLTGGIGIAAIGMLAGVGYMFGFIVYDHTKVWAHSNKFELFMDAEFILVGIWTYLFYGL